jgi:hypothetical protein
MRSIVLAALGVLLAVHSAAAGPSEAYSKPIPVTAENFVRAESSRYMSAVVREGGFARLIHNRVPSPIEQQTAPWLNRDTLYSAAVFDLDAGSVRVTIPDPGQRFLSMQWINEDQFTQGVFYGGGTFTLTRGEIGSRYVLVGIRTLADPDNPADLDQVHALQDAIMVHQKDPGRFDIPNWDQGSRRKVRAALLVLARTLPDSRGMFGARDQVDPMRRVIGAASAWGGNPQKEAAYLNVKPKKNDGVTVHKLNVKNVPVSGFWSISVYNASGYYEKNPQNAYTLNSVTAVKGGDESIDIQFGGCDGRVPNCLPIVKGWSYVVRLYRPRAEILKGKWAFPPAEPVP